MGSEPYTLTARWVFPALQPPLARGTVTIQGDRIVAVDKAGTRSADLDLGNVALLPGFTNAHTHLDLSDALGQCPPTPDFTDWLRAVIAHRRRQTPEDVGRAIDMGLSQCLRYGTTLVGDISAGGKSWDKVAAAPVRAVVFHELLGLSEERAKEAYDAALKWTYGHGLKDKCVAGLSPHAPYSVRASLFLEISRNNYLEDRVPVAIHLAETSAELLLLQERAGPFVSFLAELGVWDPGGLSDVQAILDLGFGGRALYVHCNYLSVSTIPPDDVVYCPRTHAAFRHPPHPFRRFLDNGARVSLGTDSLASNPDLDVLAEARFVHARHSDFPGALLLRMATLSGAAALGFDQVTGSLTQGKSADLVILPLPDDDAADPHRLVLESSLSVKAVIFQGKVTYSTDGKLSLP
jgi:cytosine/adenosine deaminase-related metal-dependent hydrolase